jgi:hypothetical protein
MIKIAVAAGTDIVEADGWTGGHRDRVGGWPILIAGPLAP